MKIQFFDSIHISPPKNKIYSRLGYAENLTVLTWEQRKKIDENIEKALDSVSLKGAGVRIPIKAITSSEIKLSKEIIFKSKSLVKFLNDCQEVLLIAATAGEKIGECIRQSSEGGDMTYAVILDAVGSEMADSALIWIISYFDNQVKRENKYVMKKRFSAGYGDFLLDNQKIIWDILKLKKIGVNLTEKYILIPEKTVTAVSGIKLISG